MSEVNREVSLEYGDHEFTFNLTPLEVTKYFNSITQSNKVAPAYNLLMTTVKQEQKAKLKPLLENPVTTINLGGALMEEYGPKVEVIVKKPSTTPKA